jgi:hypothetical protein
VLDCVGWRRLLGKLPMVLVGCALFTACNSSPVKLYPVKGKVLVKSQPANGAQIVFRPVNESSEAAGKTAESQAPISYGSVDAQGNFMLRTEPYGEGAPAGEYNVLITWYSGNPEDPLSGKSKLPAKYADPSAPILKATVKEGPNELEPFNLN